jgi:hypothetical protein
MNVATTQTSGVLSLGTLGARTGAVNINTGATSTASVNISSGTNANAPITIGSASSTTQTCAINAITTINGATTINGVSTINGATTFNGKVTVDAYEFAIKSGGADKLTFNYAIDRTDIKIKVAGDFINFTASDNTSALQIQDQTASGLYQMSLLFVGEETSINIIPAGTILTSVVGTAPLGYVLCNGASYSSTNVSTNKYRNLFNAIGYGFGGSGASFNVPNFQGAFLRGSGTQTVGSVTYGGNAVGNNPQQDAVLNPLYASNQGYFNTTSGSATRNCTSRNRITGDPVDTSTGILPRFDRTATENRPFNFTVYYYIKF